MEHQDFKVVVLRKKSPKQPSPNPNPNPKPVQDDGEIVKPKTFTPDFGKKLASLRSAKNMNRKDLALKLNVKESVIADIENGKQLYDGNIVHKLKKLFSNL